MKTIYYPNKIRSHLVTIVPMTSFTPKLTSKLRSALHFRYSIVIPRLIARAQSCTLHTAHCTLHTAHCTLHTAHCTLHTANCTLHTDILYAHQYVFRRGHSTQQAIITLIDKITKSVNSDDFVISVFIDLKKLLTVF